jgi:hypothetical protein
VELRGAERVPWLGPWSALGWLLFSGLVALPYLTYDTHWWSLWLTAIQYGPLYALLAVPLAGRRLTLRPASTQRRAAYEETAAQVG